MPPGRGSLHEFRADGDGPVERGFGAASLRAPDECEGQTAYEAQNPDVSEHSRRLVATDVGPSDSATRGSTP